MGDLTLFEALTGGAFDLLNSGGPKFFKKVKCPEVCPGGMGDFGIDRYITAFFTNLMSHKAR